MTLRDLENGGITINDAISRRMRYLAFQNELPLSEIIRRGKLNQSTISEIIQGRSMHPRISTILKFCNGCGITLEDFFHSELFRNTITDEEKKEIEERKLAHLEAEANEDIVTLAEEK